MLKKKLAYFLVTVPLAILPAGLAVTPAHAGVTAAEEAVRLLSGAQTADRKCSYLDPSERQELSRYTARAEIAATSQASPRAARTAADRGIASGRAATCSPAMEADIRETLVAAREAVAAANAPSTPAKPKLMKAKAAAAPPKSALKVTAAHGGLRFYSRVVKAYYLERECLSLSRTDGKRFWNGVARLHREVLARNGRNAVARAMAEAGRAAQGSSCGNAVQVQIGRGYKEVSSLL